MLATTLGIPLGTAQSRLSRSLAALRSALGADLEPVPVRLSEGGHVA
jgi:DNA-directed RNA polymerase specialized sigma24 family protein